MRPNLRSVIAQVTRGGRSAVCRRNFSESAGGNGLKGAGEGDVSDAVLNSSFGRLGVFKCVFAGCCGYLYCEVVNVAVYYRMLRKEHDGERESRRREAREAELALMQSLKDTHQWIRTK